MKKISLVTVYNSANCGSFLQAYALSETLRGMGGEAFFLRTGARKFVLGSAKNWFNWLRKGRFRRVGHDVRKHLRYARCHRLLAVRPMDTAADCAVFGSDEIWNVARDDFAEHPVFWGEGVRAERKVSYAPSVNTTPADHPRLRAFAEKYLPGFTALSVRDGHSRDALAALCPGRDIAQTLDPTMLLTAAQWAALGEEKARIAKKLQGKAFLAVYTYERFTTPELAAFIRGLADALGLMTVAACTYLPWCDVCEPGSPFDFLWYYHHAACVVASTFHGTAFSVTMDKPFIALGGENTKVLELLRAFRLEERNVTPETDRETLLRLLRTPPAAEKALAEARAGSAEWLRQACFGEEGHAR